MAREGFVLRYYLGQPWVIVTVLLAASAILYLLFRRRLRIEGETKRPATGAPPQPRKVEFQRSLGSGFRGIAWGQPPPPGMEVVHEDGETQFLTRRADDPRIGAVHVTSTAYSFRLNRLEAVIIELPLSGFEPLTRHLTAEWGPPRSTPDLGKHVWSDPGTGPEASQAVLEKKPESRKARLLLSSKAAQAERARSRPAG